MGLRPKSTTPASSLEGSRLREWVGRVGRRGWRGDKVRSRNRPPNPHTLCLHPSQSEQVQLLQLGWDVTSHIGMTAMILFIIN